MVRTLIDLMAVTRMPAWMLIPAALIVILVGVARIAQREHDVWDVLAGIVLGACSWAASVFILGLL